MAREIMPLEKILECVKKNKNFVLQGGAGSGKTETLSQLISALTLTYPTIRIACITHTNKAADEIASRVSGEHSISTIHSFINQLISGYKKNIHSVISKLFEMDFICELNQSDYPDKKTLAKEEHEQYKSAHKKMSKMIYIVKKVRVEKAVGKRAYDANPKDFNQKLNVEIAELNRTIRNLINEKDYRSIEYNETRFNNFNKLTYGHDGLLVVASLLAQKYPLLAKVLSDKYDCIFVDEYQDTDEKIVNLFLTLPKNGKTTVGFFGDSMQAIYESGIGTLGTFVESGKLEKVEKEDNYRCSEQVVKFINTFRDDGLTQRVAFKKVEGLEETLLERQGEVEIFYAVYNNKPNAFSSAFEKTAYSQALNFLVDKAAFELDSKTLLLTNNAVSGKAKFSGLYKIFSNYYLEPKEKIDQILKRLQLFDLFEICQDFESKNYNAILTKLRKTGLSIRKASDKKKIQNAIKLIMESNTGAIDTVKEAFKLKLLTKSEGFVEYLDRLESTLAAFELDEDFKTFEITFNKDGHTFSKMSKLVQDIDEEYFDEQHKNIKQRNFFRDLLSLKFTFTDVINYYKYEDEQTPYITMHKTKGTGIDNVLVVLEEFYWNEYDFGSIFDANTVEVAVRRKNTKLVYVACSRAKKNLRCVRLVSPEEKDKFVERFKDFKITEIQIPAAN